MSTQTGPQPPTSAAGEPRARLFLMPRPGHLVFLVLAVLYGAIVCFFKRFDVFGGDFARSGPALFACNLSRVLFLAYFVTVVSGLGLIIVNRLRRQDHLPRLDPLDRFILSFFLGAAVLTLLMFPLGFLNLYYTATALVITVPILYFARDAVAELLGDVGRQMRAGLVGAPSLVRMLNAALLLFLVASACYLLLTKGIYPGETTADGYEHYWPYQREVIRNHGIWPNEVWYNFYAAKGYGLNFLAMLLTDGMACQSVTWMYVVVSGVVLFSLLNKVLSQPTWSLAVTLVYSTCFLFTGPTWGGFHSHHLVGASWLAGTTWMAVKTLEGTGPSARTWFGVWFVLACGFAVFYPLYMVFVIPQFAFFALVHAVRGQTRPALGHGALCLGTGLVVVALLGLNYWVTGLLMENPLSKTWPLADQQRFSRWWSPYLGQYLFEGYAENAWTVQAGKALSWPYWSRVARLDYLRPIWPGNGAAVALAGGLLLGLMWSRGRRQEVRWPLLIPCATVVVLAGLVASATRLDHSVYRNYAFLCFYVCVLLGAGWKFIAHRFTPPSLVWLVPAVAACWLVVTSYDTQHRRAVVLRRAGHATRLTHYLRFAAGRLSVRQALLAGDGLAPEVLAAKDFIGHGTPLYCLYHPQGACHSFPGSGVVTEPSSFAFGRQWDVIAFGTPAAARQALQDLGINYFMLNPMVSFKGCIPFGPLFRPEALPDQFDLVLRTGDAYLLTWRGNGRTAVPAELVRACRERLDNARTGSDQWEALYLHLSESMRRIHALNQGRALPLVRPNELKRVGGF